jgi:hypothetical protein
MPASGFVDILGANNNPIRLVSLPLGSIRRIAAYYANCERLAYIFCHSKELGYWFERSASIVLIESCNNHPSALIGEVLADLYQV